MEFTKIQEQILNMYTTLCEDKKALAGEEDEQKLDPKDRAEKVKVKTMCFIPVLQNIAAFSRILGFHVTSCSNFSGGQL